MLLLLSSPNPSKGFKIKPDIYRQIYVRALYHYNYSALN